MKGSTSGQQRCEEVLCWNYLNNCFVEDIIISGLIESGHGFEIITEERAAFATCAAPRYRIVVDPVDGSTNVARGIMTAAVALAVLPIDEPVSPEHVQWALVGELFSGTVYQAQRGSGAFRNGHRCQTSTTMHLSECIAGLNFDGRDLATLSKLIMQKPVIGKVRRTLPGLIKYCIGSRRHSE